MEIFKSAPSPRLIGEFKMRRLIILVSLLLLSQNYSTAQNRPFPQNVNYPYGFRTTLISPDAIQNYYNSWKNIFLIKCNDMYRIGTEDLNRTISESIGYGMLLTAYHGDKEYFDGLFDFYKSKRTDNAYGLMAWEVTCDGITDPGSATDGDLDVAFALIVAYNQWGGNYLEEAKNILSILKTYYFVKCGRGYYTMKPGGQFGGCNLTDLSYYTPGYFRVFEEVTGDSFWGTAAEHSYVLLQNGANDTTGLVPDWMSFDGIPGGSGRTGYYHYDAARTPWRFSLDYIWNGNSDAEAWCTKVTNFAASIGASSIVDGYDLDGTPRGQYNNSAFVGGFAVGAMCNSRAIVDEFAGRLLQLNNSISAGQYFNTSLKNIYMLVLTGNFWNPVAEATDIKEKVSLPVGYKLEQNYPNPFNPVTKINYAVPHKTHVKLEVYDILGNDITTLVNEEKQAGIYEVDFMPTYLSSGLYFYRLKADDYIETKKMILLR